MNLSKAEINQIFAIASYFALALAAFFTLLYWGQSPFAAFLVDKSYFYVWPTHLIFFVDFLLMCVAMMLPTIMPLMEELREKKANISTNFKVILGFLFVWGSYGAGLRILALNLANMENFSSIIAKNALLSFEFMLLVCGIYMISPIAQNCANACRTPQNLIERNSKSPKEINGFKLGVDYGVNCFSCCWPSMTILILLGMANPLWMLVGTIVMVWQKGPFFSHYSNYIIGASFIIAAILLYFGWIPVKIDDGLWQAKPIFCATKI